MSSIVYQLRLWKEKKIYSFWASFSTLEIELKGVVPILSIKAGLKRSSYYAVYSTEVNAEALEFKFAVDRLVKYIYDTDDKDVDIVIVNQSGYKHTFKVSKKRKNCKYVDYRRLAYLMRYIIVCSSTKRWERKLTKKVCRYYLKDRKEIEKHDEFCF